MILRNPMSVHQDECIHVDIVFLSVSLLAIYRFVCSKSILSFSRIDITRPKIKVDFKSSYTMPLMSIMTDLYLSMMV